ncbi:MAG: DUF2860 family protein [Desulfobacterales bacterium]|nr:DUF2860 family protein [Desulfobacterales bacterium]
MKKTVCLISCGFIVCMGSVLPGHTAQADAGGFGGDIYLGGIWITGRTSQLDASGGNRRIDELDERGERESNLVPFVSGELRYSLADTGTTFFVSNEDVNAGLVLGVSQSWEDWGRIRVAGIYTRRDVWENPYLVGTRRSRTDETGMGLTFDYENILDSGFNISSSIITVDVDDDQIGQIEKNLRREGYRSGFEVGYVWLLNANLKIIPTARYEIEGMRGMANASDGLYLALAQVWQDGPWCFETRAEVGWAGYRDRHPIFDKTRKARAYDLSAQLSYYEPFGWSQLSVYGLAACGRTDANIAFFDSDALMVATGIGYHF